MAQSAFDGVIIPHYFPVVQYFCNISEILFYVIRLTGDNITVNKLYRDCKLFVRGDLGACVRDGIVLYWMRKKTADGQSY